MQIQRIVYIFSHPQQGKSLYISPAVSNFNGTEIEVWAGFGPDGSTEKNCLGDYEQLLREVFSFFHRQKKLFFKYCSVRTLIFKMKVKKSNFFLGNLIMYEF